MRAIVQNVRYAVRILSKSPGFTLVVVLTLALGIGANTAIFSVVYAALLRPLPYKAPDRLLFLGENRNQLDSGMQASYPDFQDWKKRSKTIQSFAGISGDAFALSTGTEPKNTFAAQATPNFFSTLGVRPALGRDFADGEDQPDGPHVSRPISNKPCEISEVMRGPSGIQVAPGSSRSSLSPFIERIEAPWERFFMTSRSPSG